ncbi:MAG: hypothetical protein KH202_13360 [Clostridiales bacterium]|jgi:hypothetical protein|nr:hypothetical protein [Clostridiales bacterium]
MEPHHSLIHVLPSSIYPQAKEKAGPSGPVFSCPKRFPAFSVKRFPFLRKKPAAIIFSEDSSQKSFFQICLRLFPCGGIFRSLPGKNTGGGALHYEI